MSLVCYKKRLKEDKALKKKSYILIFVFCPILVTIHRLPINTSHGGNRNITVLKRGLLWKTIMNLCMPDYA